MKKLNKAVTPLEKFTAKVINAKIEKQYTVQQILADLLSHGCQSGMINELIYYSDTVEFYQKHKKEITPLLRDICSDSGCTPAELFADKWNDDDFFADEQQNQNLLAWFGFEETARILADRNGIEI